MRNAMVVIVAFCLSVPAIHEATGTFKGFRRSIGGKKVGSDKYPWIAKLVSHYSLIDNLDAQEQLQLGSIKKGTCTGFFIDRYGTVMTASHCLKAKLEADHRLFELRKVEILFGSYTMLNSCFVTKVKAKEFKSRIRHHPEAIESTKDLSRSFIDLAIIYTDFYGYDDPMDCNKSNVGTIQISKSDGKDNGTVAGFGKEALFEGGEAVGFQCADEMNEIDLRYNEKIDMNGTAQRGVPDWREAPSFSAFATGKKIIQMRQGGNNTTTISLEGTCEGDSGAPYMVPETSNGKQVLRFRGVAIRMNLAYENGKPVKKTPCTEAGEGNIIADINYLATRVWLARELDKRYQELNVLPQDGTWDHRPLACPE